MQLMFILQKNFNITKFKKTQIQNFSKYSRVVTPQGYQELNVINNLLELKKRCKAEYSRQKRQDQLHLQNLMELKSRCAYTWQSQLNQDLLTVYSSMAVNPCPFTFKYGTISFYNKSGRFPFPSPVWHPSSTWTKNGEILKSQTISSPSPSLGGPNCFKVMEDFRSSGINIPPAYRIRCKHIIEKYGGEGSNSVAIKATIKSKIQATSSIITETYFDACFSNFFGVFSAYYFLSPWFLILIFFILKSIRPTTLDNFLVNIYLPK